MKNLTQYVFWTNYFVYTFVFTLFVLSSIVLFSQSIKRDFNVGQTVRATDSENNRSVFPTSGVKFWQETTWARFAQLCARASRRRIARNEHAGTMRRTWPRTISNSRKLGFVDGCVTSEERARTKVAARLIVGRTLLKKKKKGKKGEKKGMRGRTRELCREANDTQNWFADIMRTGRVVSPALFYVSENIPRLRKRVLHEKRGVERQHPLPPLFSKRKFSFAILRWFSRGTGT